MYNTSKIKWLKVYKKTYLSCKIKCEHIRLIFLLETVDRQRRVLRRNNYTTMYCCRTATSRISCYPRYTFDCPN